MASPLSQFEVKTIIPIDAFGYDISFTNSSLAMLITVLLIVLFMYIGSRNLSVIPSRGQTVLESTYEFIAGMIGDNIGQEGMKYFSFIFSLFLFILIGNLLGMFPYSFTWTSNIILFDNVPTLRTFIGISIIIGAGIYIYLREKVKDQMIVTDTPNR